MAARKSTPRKTVKTTAKAVKRTTAKAVTRATAKPAPAGVFSKAIRDNKPSSAAAPRKALNKKVSNYVNTHSGATRLAENKPKAEREAGLAYERAYKANKKKR